MDEALNFIRSLPSKVQEKITYNYKKIEHGVMDNELFKKLENSNIWEFRTLYNGNCYRLFSFWDTNTETLVIATHGIMKKSQKTSEHYTSSKNTTNHDTNQPNPTIQRRRPSMGQTRNTQTRHHGS